MNNLGFFIFGLLWEYLAFLLMICTLFVPKEMRYKTWRYLILYCNVLQHKPVLRAVEDVIKAAAQYVPNLGHGIILLPFKNLFF